MNFIQRINERLNTLLTGTAPASGTPGTLQFKPAPPRPAPATAETARRYDGPWPLDRPLIHFSTIDTRGQDARVPFSLGNAYEGVFVFGANGSGKSSGTGRYFAHAFLKAGMGGLVLTAKPSETKAWIRYAEEAGRRDDLVVFGEDEISAAGSGFNFLSYELTHAQGNPAEAACGVLMELVGANRTGGNHDPIWEKATRRLLRSCLAACQLAGETATIEHIHTLATDRDAAQATLAKAAARAEAGELTPSQVADLRPLQAYLGTEWQKMAPATKSSILMNATSLCDPFLTGTMRDLFTTHTSHTPDDIFAGKIIVVNTPEKTYHEAGRSGNVAWKYCLQRAAERRTPTDQDRPIFIYADEAQFFITPKDGEFVTTSRSCRCSTIYLTQNRPNLLARLSKEQTDALLGCYQTKVFHQNGDPETNEWAANVIAKTYQTRTSTTANYQVGGSQGGQGSGGTSQSQSLEHQLLPGEFLALAKGGPEFNYIVTAYLFQSGKLFPESNKTFVLLGFRQRQISI